MMKWKELIMACFKVVTSIWLEGLRNSRGCRDGRSSGQESNPKPTVYEAGLRYIRLQHSVRVHLPLILMPSYCICSPAVQKPYSMCTWSISHLSMK